MGHNCNKISHVKLLKVLYVLIYIFLLQCQKKMSLSQNGGQCIIFCIYTYSLVLLFINMHFCMFEYFIFIGHNIFRCQIGHQIWSSFLYQLHVLLHKKKAPKSRRDIEEMILQPQQLMVLKIRLKTKKLIKVQ